ncbi:hypothetical protein CVT24_007258 [Panaeolus cyanescens]|uniref:Tyrosinase copper-binding domain-containing protein n=1 Tax=Panaeolus cyanescens TaxID=181874 RepID=A0A409W5M2_9AGAR|nr:hypothetical protein CVT24_007258 [Panaeolus cyanescens]
MGRLVAVSTFILLNIAGVASRPATTNNAMLDIFQLQHQSQLAKLLPGTFNTTGLACPSIRKRREWRTLSDIEKADYISAVKCLQSTPVKTPQLPQVKSLFDQFQAVHITVADSVHVAVCFHPRTTFSCSKVLSKGQFLPWHRYFLQVYEKSLRDKCSYKGDIPYWNWSLDVDNGKKFSESPLFSADAKIGFGGDGVRGTYVPPEDPTGDNRIVSPDFYHGCVQDGAFAGLTLQLGPGRNVGPHCLTRGLDNDVAAATLNSNSVAYALTMPEFESFRTEIEGQPVMDGPRTHDGGHIAIGGEMSNFYSSPGEPLFYLHHAHLDHIWWKWQNADPEKRMYQVTGRTTPEDDFRNVTLEFPLSVGQLDPGHGARIGDMMNIRQQPNCYDYE